MNIGTSIYRNYFINGHANGDVPTINKYIYTSYTQPMNNNYTLKATEALQKAQDTATLRKHSVLTNLHLLDALLNQSDGLVPQLI
jgi:hypothetical protein